MSDFLTRLAQRALGVAPTIQPLTASVFEPIRELTTEQPSFDMEQEYVSDNEGRQPFASHKREAKTTYAPAQIQATDTFSVEMEQQYVSSNDGGQPSSFSSTEARTTHTQVISPTPKEREPDMLRSPHPSSTHEQGEIPEGRAHNARIAYPSVTSPTVREQVQGIQRVPFSSREGSVPETSSPKSQSSLLQSNTQAHLPVRRAMRPLVTTHPETHGGALPSISSYKEDSTRTGQSGAAPQPPTIQVTIGRIEVRATPPQTVAQPQRAQPTSPRMSLDDYLKQRSRGGKS